MVETIKNCFSNLDFPLASIVDHGESLVAYREWQ
jgi:hypothetical protein